MELLTNLSPRESTVLLYIAWGYTNKEISNILGLSVKTVEAHKANGMRKLNVSRRAELVLHAVKSGWLTPENVPSVSAPPVHASAHLRTYTSRPS